MIALEWVVAAAAVAVVVVVQFVRVIWRRRRRCRWIILCRLARTCHCSTATASAWVPSRSRHLSTRTASTVSTASTASTTRHYRRSIPISSMPTSNTRSWIACLPRYYCFHIHLNLLNPFHHQFVSDGSPPVEVYRLWWRLSNSKSNNSVHLDIFRVTTVDWRCNAVAQRRRPMVVEAIWQGTTGWTHSTEWITNSTTIKTRVTLIWTTVWNRCVSVWRSTLSKEPTIVRNFLPRP